jgi:hypothetical protein
MTHNRFLSYVTFFPLINTASHWKVEITPVSSISIVLGLEIFPHLCMILIPYTV